MKIERFEIHLEPRNHSRSHVIETGSDLRGYVFVKANHSLKVESIRIHVEGKGKTKWVVKSGQNDKTVYRGRETYADYTLYLFGGNENQTLTLEEGEHMYPFVVPLSRIEQLPSSFEGKKGYVRYTIEAHLIRPWKANEYSMQPFTVINHLDLNNIEDAMMPIIQASRQEVEGCCCSEGEVGIQINLNKSGFVPGEPIITCIEINNQSENPIREWYIKLVQDVTYTGFSDSLWSSGNPKYKTKSDEYNLVVSLERVLNKGQRESFTYSRPLPSLPPSSLRGCNIIDISYSINFSINSGWTSISVAAPIIVGTIPLRTFMPPSQQPAPVPSAPSEQTNNTTSALPTIDAPPSYEECVSGPVVFEEDDDNNPEQLPSSSWAPAYPYYNWNVNVSDSGQNMNEQVPEAPPPSYDSVQFSNIT